MPGERPHAAATSRPADHAELRTAVFYFISFTSSGAAVAYAGIWFAGQGLDSARSG